MTRKQTLLIIGKGIRVNLKFLSEFKEYLKSNIR